MLPTLELLRTKSLNVFEPPGSCPRGNSSTGRLYFCHRGERPVRFRLVGRGHGETGDRFDPYVVYSGETNGPDGPSVKVAAESAAGAPNALHHTRRIVTGLSSQNETVTALVPDSGKPAPSAWRKLLGATTERGNSHPVKRDLGGFEVVASDGIASCLKEPVFLVST